MLLRLVPALFPFHGANFPSSHCGSSSRSQRCRVWQVSILDSFSMRIFSPSFTKVAIFLEQDNTESRCKFRKGNWASVWATSWTRKRAGRSYTFFGNSHMMMYSTLCNILASQELKPSGSKSFAICRQFIFSWRGFWRISNAIELVVIQPKHADMSVTGEGPPALRIYVLSLCLQAFLIAFNRAINDTELWSGCRDSGWVSGAITHLVYLVSFHPFSMFLVCAHRVSQ